MQQSDANGTRTPGIWPILKAFLASPAKKQKLLLDDEAPADYGTRLQSLVPEIPQAAAEATNLWSPDTVQ
jgi:hypothetical protein